MESVIDTMRKIDPETSELETRLVNVSFEDWRKIRSSLRNFCGWKTHAISNQYVDYYLCDKTRVRCNECGSSEAIVKTRIDYVEQEVLSQKLRLTVSTEIPVLYECDIIKNVVFVRIKTVESFLTFSGWRFDISEVRTAANYEKAQTQKNTYEIELELEDKSYIKKNTNNYVAESILMKITDLVKINFDTQDNNYEYES